jgi:hypothetical protein
MKKENGESCFKRDLPHFPPNIGNGGEGRGRSGEAQL